MNCSAAEDGTLRITATRSPPGLAISGEIDESTYGDLVDTLARFADGAAELHVGLAGVEYCDLAGLRAIVGLAQLNGQRRRVVLHDVPPASKDLLRILGWDTTPGLAIAERPRHPSRARARGPGRPGSARLAPATTRALGGGRRSDWEPGSEIA